MSLLEVNHLSVSFTTRGKTVEVVRDVSFSVQPKKTLAIVGESGSGKSVTSMSILRLLDANGHVENGEVLLQTNANEPPRDLMKLSLRDLQSVRGNEISVVFQEPMTALNPVLTIGKQLCEPLIVHRHFSRREAEEIAVKKLMEVQIASPERMLKEYPHRLSGGMRQRVMIAMALACQPKLLIADEPTTALDVTIQAQILSLMRALQDKNGTAILFITHDLGVVNEMADEVAVMYAGEIVEMAKKSMIFSSSAFRHPYTEGLLTSLPGKHTAGKRLECIGGNVPSLSNLPKGCKFAPRCKYCTAACVEQTPPLITLPSGQKIRCLYPDVKKRRAQQETGEEYQEKTDKGEKRA